MMMLMMMPISKNVDSPLDSLFSVLFLACVDRDESLSDGRLTDWFADNPGELDNSVGAPLIWLSVVVSPNAVTEINRQLAMDMKMLKSHARGFL